MVQEFHNKVRTLEEEVRKLRGELDRIAIGGTLKPGVVPGSDIPAPRPGHILIGISNDQWGQMPLPAWGWDEGGEGGGGDGDPGPPGPPGPAGANGSIGPMGPMGALVWMEPDEPDMAMPIPGAIGATGATGSAGPAGAVTPPVLGVMHDELGDNDIDFPPGNTLPPFIGARVRHSTTQTIGTGGGGTAVAFDTEDYDLGGCHASGTNTRLVAPVSGYYNVQASIAWDSNALGSRNLWVTRNSDGMIPVANKVNPDDATDIQQSISADIYLAAGDYVTFTVLQDSGTNRTIGTATSANQFACSASIRLLS